MPDMYFDVDTAITECPVNLLPLLDATDFKTIEDAVAYNAAGMALYWHFCTSAGAYTVTAVTPTTAGNYDWTDQGAAGIYTIEIPASGGASINNDTEGYGWFTGVATGVLPWRGPVIGFRAAAINDALCDGGDLLDVSLVQMAGDTQSATDLKDFADAGYDPATNKVQGVVLTDTLTTYTGNTPQTGDSYARLGAPAGASIAADLLAIDNFVDGLESTIGAAGAGLTALPWNAAWDAEVQSEVNDGLVAYSAASTTNITAGTITTATNVTTVNGLAANVITAASIAADAGAEIADAVWDELLSGHAISGSTGEALSSAGTAGDPWTTALPGAYGAGTAGKIIGDNINATISSRSSQTSVDDLPTNAELATALGTADDAVLAQVALVKADTAAILIDTAEIGAAGAGLTALATASALATAQTDLDTITGSDGVTLASTQGNSITFQPIIVTAGDAIANVTLAGTGSADGLAFTRSGAGNLFDTNWAAAVQQEAADALTAYDPPTNAEMEARTLVSAGYATPTNITAGTITTATNVTTVNGLAANVITATSINADAITAAKVAADVHQETIELAFTYNATADYAGATAGSLVKEIADNAGGSVLTAADIADAVWDEAQADHVTAGSFGITASEIADILVDTAEIGAAGAGLTNITLNAASVDLIWDESLAAHQTVLSAGRAMTLGGVPVAETTLTGTPSTTSMQLVAGAATDDIYKDHTLVVVSGAGAGQAQVIASYTGATKTCTFAEAFAVAPAASDAVVIRADHVHPVTDIQSGLATAASIAALNNIAATDIVSAGAITTLAGAVVNVDLVDVCTTNTDMRGTDGANTTAPDNASIAAILVDTAEIGAAGAGLTVLATQVSVNDLPTNAELATALGTADDAVLTQVALVKAKTDLIPAAPAAVGDIPTAAENATAVFTTQMTESYRANGAAPTLAQGVCETLAHLGEASVAGTTLTLKEFDGSTTAETFTLDSATTPTSVTRET